MNDALTRAAAIEELIGSGAYREAPQPVAEAVVSCCYQLLDAGEPGRAIELLKSSAELQPVAEQEWALRLGVVHARALSLAGSFQDSLRLLEQLSSEHAGLLPQRHSEFYQIRICEASNLWGLNRVDEAAEKLLGIRAELLLHPDSYLLGWCAFQLASAETVRGEHHQARRFALEAIVSARRSDSRYLEASALLTYSLLERALCRWTGAGEAAEESLSISRDEGFSVLECHALRSVAIVAWKRGETERALRLSRDQLQRAAEIGNGRLQWFATLLRGMVLLHVGGFDEALRLFELGARWDVPESQSRPSLLTTEFLGDIHLEQGEAVAALRYYDEVWPKALALVPKGDIVAELRRRRAECYHLLGRHEEAYAEAQTGLAHCRELGDRYEEAATYRVLGLTAAAVGEATEAHRWFEQACELQLNRRARKSGRSPSRGYRVACLRRRSPRGSLRPESLPAAA